MQDKDKKIIVSEDMHIEKEWFEEAKKQTLSTLPEFIRHIMNDYTWDYGVACHQIAACALAAAYAANEEPGACGGITGFQAGFVMWDFIFGWNHSNNKCGLRIVDYDNMLYPQYAEKFEKTISRSVWNSLQEEAKKNLIDKDYVHPEVRQHWRMIVDGVVPFGYVVKDD